MLPYLERRDLYDLWRSPQQTVAAGLSWPPQVNLDVLNCPSSPVSSSLQTPCVYVVNSGMDDVFPQPGATSDLYPADFQANGMFFNHRFQVTGANVAPFASCPCVNPIVYTNQNYVTANDGSACTLLATENNNVPAFAPAGVPLAGLSGGPASWGDPATAAFEKQNCFIWWPEKNPDPAMKINGPAATTNSSKYYYYFLHPASAHPGGVNASFCDGHVRYLNQDIDYAAFCLLMTPKSSECNTPGTIGGLDGEGGVPISPTLTTLWYTTSNYPYTFAPPSWTTLSFLSGQTTRRGFFMRQAVEWAPWTTTRAERREKGGRR